MTAIAEPLVSESPAGWVVVPPSHAALPRPPRSPAHHPAPLGQALVGAKLITEDELQTALQRQSEEGRKIGELVLELGLVSEDELLPFLEKQLGFPAIRLREGLIDPVAARLIPQDIAQRLKLVGLFKVRRTLCVAMTDPHNLLHRDEVERATGLRVRPVFAFQSSIERILKRCYEQDFAVDTVTADFAENEIQVETSTADVSVTSIEGLIEGSPIVNLVNYMVLQAMRQGASDIHLEPAQKTSVVRFRIDGQLVEVLRPRRDIHPALVSRIKVMGKMDIAEHHLPQDGRCQVIADGKQVDLRISSLPTVLGEKIVIRLLDKQRLTFDLEKLGLPSQTLAEVKRLLAKPHGLLLVTGPTGSGKTTTMYSALELIKSVHRNIVTVEDPVEYQIELVNQVHVSPSRSLTFASALRAILRQDPDVIMIGEIRDAETAKVAVQAALTGHLVLSTLHTNDSAGAVTRLVDMGVESYKVAACLIGVVAQRLVRTICPHCKTAYYPRSDMLDAVRYSGDRRRTFLRGEGCRACFDTGYHGRLGVYEVLTVASGLRELIARNADLETIRKWFVEQGGQTLLDQALRLAEKELTSLDEVARIAFVE